MPRAAAAGVAAFVAFAAFTAGTATAGDEPTRTTLYKSVGPDGRIVYADRPPVDGRQATTMRFENLPSSPLAPETLAYLQQLEKAGERRAALAAAPETLLFTARWCGPCKQAKAFLASRGAPFLEIDVEAAGGPEAFARAGGRRGVPFLVRGDRRVTGFTAAAYAAVLDGAR